MHHPHETARPRRGAGRAARTAAGLALIPALAALPEPMLVDALNRVRRALHAVSPFRDEPVDLVEWVPADAVRSRNAAAVLVNASTRFTDGGEFGFGAEIGISTQKLHARGPMALPELTTTKWVVEGEGHTR